MTCKVLDRSQTGAKLVMTTLLGLPDRFHVSLPPSPPRPAVIVRKETGRVAIRFVD